MPLCSHAPVARWLAADSQIPLDSRPVFLFQFLVGRQQIQLSRAVKSIAQMPTETDDDRHAIAQAMQAAVMIGLKGWRNISKEGAPVEWGTPLDQFLNAQEIWELIGLTWATDLPAAQDFPAKPAA